MDTSKRIVAYHEAGHVVAAIEMCWPLAYATISPADGLLGKVSHGDLPLDYDPHGGAVIALAGGIAEYTYCGDAAAVISPEGYNRRHFGDLLEATVAIVQMYQKSHPGEMPPADAGDYFKREARDIVLRRGGAVRAIAAALMERGTLTGDELLTIYRDSLAQGNS